MKPKYTGTRYAANASPDLVEYVESGSLHCLDYEEALNFYLEVAAHLPASDMAYLGCVDRFYLFTTLLGRHDGLNPWLYDRCREVELDPDYHLDLWAREHYKAVDVNEPVPTPTGFKKHGDLKAGDWVFGSDGNPVKVVAKTEVFTDADCYRVTLDDGYSVVVSGDHLWTVEKKSRKRISGETREYRAECVLNTREMAKQDHASDHRLAIRGAPPGFQVEHILPIAPYYLGAWLGDGTSENSSITTAYTDHEIIERIRACGYPVHERASSNANSGLYSVDPGIRGQKGTGARSVLNELGLIKNKHIPRDYLVSSVAQRLELLRGLMDTDGSCDTRGTAVFVNKNERLSKDVFSLVASLGMKPRFNTFKYDHGNVYHVSFQAYKEMNPFHLTRKAQRAKDGVRVARRFVKSVELVETIPVSCIQVAAKDGCYLIGTNHVTTHNSTLITFCGCIQEIINDPDITIGVFSHTKGIATKFVQQLRNELETNTTLRLIYPDVLWIKPRSEAPVWSSSEFTVRRKSNPKEATVEAHGLVEGQPTSRHFLLRVYDDVVTRESVTTAEQIKKTTEAWELSDNLGAGEGRFWMPGTRYAFGDTYGEIISRGVAKVRLYPATENGKLDGKPVFLSQEAWDKKKKTQRSQIAAQMLQNPLSGKERTFEPKWFKAWQVRPALLNIYIMADPSRGRSSNSDRTAIAVIGVDAQSNKFLLDGFCHRMKLSERWDMLKHLHKKWRNAPGVAMVTVGYERFGQQSDDEYFAERMREEHYSFPIKELSWPREGDSSKKARVERLQPDIEYGAFFFPSNVYISGQGECTWEADLDEGAMVYTPVKGETAVRKRLRERGQEFLASKPLRKKNEMGEVYDLTVELMNEMLFFPFATHDDLVDATSRIYDMEPMPASRVEESEERDDDRVAPDE